MSETLLILRRIQRDIVIYVNMFPCKIPAIPVRFLSKFNFLEIFLKNIPIPSGTRWRSWLRHCATSRKVAGSIPDGVSGIFHSHNPSGRTTALGSTQPLTEMSTRNISWGVKAAGA